MSNEDKTKFMFRLPMQARLVFKLEAKRKGTTRNKLLGSKIEEWAEQGYPEFRPSNYMLQRSDAPSRITITNQDKALIEAWVQPLIDDDNQPGWSFTEALCRLIYEIILDSPYYNFPLAQLQEIHDEVFGRDHILFCPW